MITITTEHRNAMTKLFNSRGQIAVIKGERRMIIDVRDTYGAGIELTLARPLTGKLSRLVNISADEASKAIKIADSLS